QSLHAAFEPSNASDFLDRLASIGRFSILLNFAAHQSKKSGEQPCISALLLSIFASWNTMIELDHIRSDVEENFLNNDTV
ncbi:MAG TPA: hypothetical protein VJQ26_00640, partial [Ktedonobacteraceae bacterium]|nr:hypothetical protein [Ktedonobacteraceae bacterium]